MRFIKSGIYQDGQGNAIASGTVSVYLAGTSLATAATIYSTSTGGTSVNSITTSSDGSFTFYVDTTNYSGSQKFDIVLSKTNYQAKALYNVEIIPENIGLEVDIRRYATSVNDLTSGVEDLGIALQAAFNDNPSGCDVVLPVGTFKWTTRVYCDSATAVATFKLKGCGKGTILKPNGFTSGYVLYVNEDSGGSRVLSSTRHPRLIVEDLSVNGTDSTSVSFVWYNTASVQFNNLTFDNLLYGLYGTGYVDLVKMDAVWWSHPRTNGWLYRQGGMGDGFSGRQLFSGGSEIGNNMVWLYRCHGGSIVDSIGGYYRFEECSAIAVRDGHFEERTTTEGNHGFQIINSHVVLENNHIRSDFSTYDSVYVDDVDATKQSTLLVLRNNIFVKNLNNGSTIATRDIRINNLKASSKVILDMNMAMLFNVDISDMSPWDWYQQGIRVRSAIGALDTALLNVVPLLSGQAVIENLSGSWVIRPMESLDIPLRAMATPTIDAITQVASPSSDLVDTTTYYYRVENVDCFSRYGVASAETSKLQSGTNSNKIEISGLAPNSFVRVMRGTSADTYDRYVDIPTIGGSIVIHDSGSRINQYVWTVAAYTHHTTGVTYTGVHNAVTSTKTLYGTAAPTAGTWVVGDKMYDTGVASGGMIGWVCTTAGSPGTWSTFGPVVAGDVIQVATYQTGALATGTTVMPYDDTIPQKTEGDEYMTLAITPKSSTSKLVIESTAIVSASAAVTVVGALFQDSAADALAGTFSTISVGLDKVILNFTHIMTAGTTSATTFKLRIGPHSAATVTLNGSGAARALGGVASSSMVITEIRV